jgi:hypothetical protein
MKIITLAAIAALSVTPLFAGEVTRVAHAEYQVEAKAVELGAGLGYEAENILLSMDATVMKPNSSALVFDSLEVGAAYKFSEDLKVYTTVTLDSDLQYQEAVVGVNLAF